MGDRSAIAWTDATLQIVSGCEPDGPDCLNCYSAELCGTRLKSHPRCQGLTRRTESGRHVWTGEVRVHPDQLDLPSRWRRPRLIFLGDRGDLFHPSVPLRFVEAVYEMAREAHWHRYQVLTKRPDRMAEAARDPYVGRPALANVWLGISAGNQDTFDRRWPPMFRVARAGWPWCRSSR